MDLCKAIKGDIKITRDWFQIITIYNTKYIENLIQQLHSALSTILRIVMDL